MKFGKSLELERHQLPEAWQPYVVHYKGLKRCIRAIVSELVANDAPFRLDPTAGELAVRLGDGRIVMPTEVAYAFSRTGIEVHPELRITLLDGNLKCTSGQELVSSDENMDVLEGMFAHSKSILNEEGIVAPSIKQAGDAIPGSVDHISLDPIAPSSADPILRLHTDSTSAAPATNPSDSLLQPVHDPMISEAPAIEKLPTTTDADKIDSSQAMTVSFVLKADETFFRQLTQTLTEVGQFHKDVKTKYHQRIQDLALLLSKGASPYSTDIYTWREIIQLYIDAAIWTVESENACTDRPVTSARQKHDWFLAEEKQRGLHEKLRTAASKQAMHGFVGLLKELMDVRQMQSLNQTAVNKILKKHDKRTHLSAKSHFPTFMSCDTLFSINLSRDLAVTVYTEFSRVIPQLIDYSCPICFGLCWKPIRLICGHIFCLRCLVKAQRNRMVDCAVCRCPKAIQNAYADQLDKPLMNMLELYFPKEMKAKKKESEREVALEEAQIISGMDWRSAEDRGEAGSQRDNHDQCSLM